MRTQPPKRSPPEMSAFGVNKMLGKMFSLKTESGHLLRSAFGLQVAQTRRSRFYLNRLDLHDLHRIRPNVFVVELK